MTGLRAGIPDLQVAVLLIRRKLGLLTFAELGRRLKFTAGTGLEASYLGWAVKKAPDPAPWIALTASYPQVAGNKKSAAGARGAP